MTYIEYIGSKADRIGNHPQEAFTIAEIYPGKMDRLRAIPNPSFQECLSALMNVPLTREFVRNSFRTDGAYAGFVAAMLWGGLGMTYWRSLESAMTIEKAEVEQKICNLQHLLGEDRIQDAFMSLQSPNENKFKGIDISYFTKLLYFLYNGNTSNPPIIFDKWGTFIHAGILVSQNECDLLNRFYTIGRTEKGTPYLNIKSNRATCYRYDVYADYLERMSELSVLYGLPHPGNLEEFLFGKNLNGANKNNDNPRYFVKNYVKTYCDSLNR